MQYPRFVLSTAAATALILAACGGGASVSTPSSSPSAAPSSASAKPSAASAPPSASGIASAAASGGSSAKPAASGQMTPLTVSYSAIIGNVLPVWVAQDAGIFKKNGLDVDLRYINSSKGIPALISGDVQVADIGGAETLSAVAGGADLVTVAVDAPTYPFVLMAPSSVKSVQDLKGKKIGVSEPGSSSDIATRVALRKEGLNPDSDVSIIAVGSASERIAALENGAIQAGLSFPPNTLSLEKKGFHTILDLASLHLPAALSSTVVERKYLDAHKEVVQKYVDSVVEAIAWAKQHKSETATIMGKYYKSSDQQAMASAYDYFMNEVIPSLPSPKADMYTNAQQILGARSSAVKNYDVGKMLDASFVTSAADRGLDRASASAATSAAPSHS